ncbi:hypothetical protein A2U01_0091497, partial [Trifolium medium]|nr:hypothetical protein [Trifolium medium]
MNPASFNFATSSAISSRLCSPTFLFLCDTGFVVGDMDNLWVITLSSIPDISEGCHANKSLLFLRMVMIFSFSAG